MKNVLSLKKETEIFGKIVYIIVVIMYFSALMTISCCVKVFPDSNTAFFWFDELMNSANKILFIGISFCAIYEFLD